MFWDVDTQYDFMRAAGKLYVPDAESLIPSLKRLVRLVTAVEVLANPVLTATPA